MKIVFVRHGELEGENSSVLHAANDPVVLSEKGRETMKSLALVLKDMNVGEVVSSSEIRTKESAEILAKELSLPIHSEEGLEGRKWGEFAGKTWDEVGKILGEKTLEERYIFTPPAGESWQQFESRMVSTVENIIQSGEEKNICIISHGSSIRVMLPKIFGVPVTESLKMYPDYGSISTVEYDGSSYHDPLFNTKQ